MFTDAGKNCVFKMVAADSFNPRINSFSFLSGISAVVALWLLPRCSLDCHNNHNELGLREGKLDASLRGHRNSDEGHLCPWLRDVCPCVLDGPLLGSRVDLARYGVRGLLQRSILLLGWDGL